jgi:hypothetical protein
MLVLAGGLPFPSDFGTFHAPNISPDAYHGIGDWTLPEFARAVTRGVSPEGQHYYPAFPYTAYQHLAPQDVVNLFAYMQTLPAADVPSLPHEVGFPFNIRRGLGAWKVMFFDEDFVLADASDTQVARGHATQRLGRVRAGRLADRRAEPLGQGAHSRHHARTS